MELTHEFSVAVPPARAWAVLTDVERIAPLLPGAQLTEVDGDTYSGLVKIKVGPITAQYKGKASFVEQDDVNHRAVLKAEGRDPRQGNAAATITAVMVADGPGTKVSLVTDLAISGKVAQFGRGVMADVSSKLIDQFVEKLNADILSGPDTAPDIDLTAGATPHADGGADLTPTPEVAEEAVEAALQEAPVKAAPRTIHAPAAAPVDLLDAAGGSVAKRFGPYVGGIALVVVLVWWRRRIRS